jgi:hypothetical protein
VTFAYADASTQISVNSISLIPSAIPARPANESFDEVIRKCQYYYEKSYDIGIFAGAVSTNGARVALQRIASSGVNLQIFSRTIEIVYDTIKRIPITPSFYSTDGTAANLLILDYTSTSTPGFSANATVAGNWTIANSGQTGCILSPVNRTVAITAIFGGSPPSASSEPLAQFHFVADARLGIV